MIEETQQEHFEMQPSFDTNIDPLHVIKSKKAADFWKSNGWAEKAEVDWEEFKDAYQKYVQWRRMNAEQARGFKKLLCKIYFLFLNNIQKKVIQLKQMARSS